MESDILIPNFYKGKTISECAITTKDLGWSDMIKKDAKSDYPETIFRYIVEVLGFNVLFYWLRDKQWYCIETEKNPIEVRRIYSNPNWNGKFEYDKSGTEGVPHTSSQGEILATFDDPTKIWNNLKIEGVSICEILENSVITDLD